MGAVKENQWIDVLIGVVQNEQTAISCLNGYLNDATEKLAIGSPSQDVSRAIRELQELQQRPRFVAVERLLFCEIRTMLLRCRREFHAGTWVIYINDAENRWLACVTCDESNLAFECRLKDRSEEICWSVDFWRKYGDFIAASVVKSGSSVRTGLSESRENVKMSQERARSQYSRQYPVSERAGTARRCSCGAFAMPGDGVCYTCNPK